MTQITTMVWSFTESQTYWNVIQWALWSITANNASGDDEMQLSYFKFLRWWCESAALNICKFGKFSIGYRTGKGQFCFLFFVFPNPKDGTGNVKQFSNYFTIVLISHTSKVCSKFSQPGFNSTWTKNFQRFKLDLEKAEEPEIKLLTSVGS